MMKNNIFNDENEEVDLSKSEINAKKIMKRIHTHNIDAGGIFSLITGAQGTAKTSVMLSFMDYAIEHHKDEKIFWSSTYCAPLQFVKSKNPYTILVKKESGVTFHDRNDKLKQIYPEIVYFTDYQDLYEKALPGCNAVFFGNRYHVMGLIHHLRGVGEWCHVFIDELSEICPAFTSGKLFHQIGNFAIDCKEVRKCQINLHSNSQSVADIDHRVRSKVMLKIFLPGSRAGSDSRLSQMALDNLSEDNKKGNESYLEQSGRFGKVRFTDIYKPIPEKQWEARVNDS